MPESDVARHYARRDLLDRIRDGLAKLGRTPENVGVDDLAPADEFHIGGRQASEDFFPQLGFAPDNEILDIGCGLGGPARFVADRFGCRVTGIDLTPDYVTTGNTLSAWAGLANRVTLREGSALALPFGAEHFDGAYMVHVGMNIADKAALFRAVAAALKPGAVVGIYDVMRVGEGNPDFPVPWATTEATSHLATPDAYRDALTSAGFVVEDLRTRRDFALAFFEKLRARMAAAGGPPPLGLHLVMGDTTATKIKHMVDAIADDRIAPVELVARKPG